MPTETLRRGDELSPAVTQADGVGFSCSNGCGAPMMSIDLFAFAHQCSACGDVAVDHERFGVIAKSAASSVDRALDELRTVATRSLPAAHSAAALFDAYTATRAAVLRATDLLTVAPVEAYADAIHAAAIDAAARICALRAESQHCDSKNPVAGLEATKCAFAVQRLRRRSSIAERPELASTQPIAPEAAHA